MSDEQKPLLMLASPLGDDTRPFQENTLHAIALSARERLSQPFKARITAVSTRRAIDPNELVGRPVCLTVRLPPRGDRFIHGVVRRLEAVSQPLRDRWHYVLDVVPKLRLMDQAADCRVFQDCAVEEILRTLFAEHDVSPVEFRIFDGQPRREYTTQYNETGLDFAHRLMQESGWFYFFEHSSAAHTLVVTDRNQSFRSLDPLEYRVVHTGDNVDVLSEWKEALQTAHGRVRLEDYDPTRPRAPVLGQQETILRSSGASRRRVFRWPAMTRDDQVAAQRARFRVEASEAEAQAVKGRGYDPEFAPGRRFTLDSNPFTRARGVDYALIGVEHEAVDETWITDGAKASYRNGFACVRQDVPWREPQTLPRPAMAGTFSAIVLGHGGEEIHADPLGRIKVRLLFDHRQDTVAAQAVWARVAQPWSGDAWGWQHLPRVGTEVAVSFMSGDPDAPVVVGCFYHQDALPAFPIPAQQTRQGFRSRSTLNGSTQDYSELSFDDAKGEELVYLRAQKDQVTKVENDQTVTVANNHKLTSQMGGITVTAMAGAVNISAATQISLSVGPSSITITPTTIELLTMILTQNAMTINIDALTAVSIKAPAVSVLASEFIAVPPPNVPAP